MKKRNRLQVAGAIVLGSTWVCVAHGTVNAQGTKCQGCVS